MRLQTGNTSGWVYGQMQQQAVMLSGFTIVNKGATPINANLYVNRSNVKYSIIPVNTPIYGNDMYPRTEINPINLDSGDSVVLLVTGGDADYTFSYNPLK